MFREMFFAAALALGIAGCVSTSAPVAVADQTVLDEKAGIAAEVAYTAVAKAIVVSIRAGLITDRAKLEKIRDLDAKAYAALQATRAAYKSGNALSYSAALAEGNLAVRSILSLL